MKYYYVIFHCGPYIGHWVVRHTETPDGFNIADGHKKLFEMMGLPCIIADWKEINEKRYEEFARWTNGMSKAGTCDPSKPPPPKLNIHQGGRDDHEPSCPAGDLKPVPQPPEKE